MTQRPILLDIPDFFESERLVLRAPRPSDGDALNAAVIESLAELRPWMPWAMTAPTLADSEEYVRRSAVKYAAREDLPLLLWQRATGALVGGSGMHRIDWEVPAVEIGYWVRTSQAGQGYITEAVNAITHFAFEVIGAHRVEIRCDERNGRSAAVARRAGFVLEGVLHNEARDHVSLGLRNTMVFAKVRLPQDDAHAPSTTGHFQQ
jgi:ribosomal-protein-serine acetyltransferase